MPRLRGVPGRAVPALRAARSRATCTASSPSTASPGLWGGYAEYQYLGPDAMVLPVPDGLDPVTATLFNPLGAGIRWGVTRARHRSRATSSRSSGPGVRGLAALVAVRAAGAGVRAGHRARAAATRRASRWPASSAPTSTVDVADRAIRSRALRGAAGRLADVVVDVTAKAPAALGQAVALARPGGTVVLAGHPRHERDAGLRARPRRLQGAADPRRARRRRRPRTRQRVGAARRGNARTRSCRTRSPGSASAATLLEAMAGDGPAVPPVHGVINPTA